MKISIHIGNLITHFLAGIVVYMLANILGYGEDAGTFVFLFNFFLSMKLPVFIVRRGENDV